MKCKTSGLVSKANVNDITFTVDPVCPDCGSVQNLRSTPTEWKIDEYYSSGFPVCEECGTDLELNHAVIEKEEKERKTWMKASADVFLWLVIAFCLGASLQAGSRAIKDAWPHVQKMEMVHYINEDGVKEHLETVEVN